MVVINEILTASNIYFLYANILRLDWFLGNGVGTLMFLILAMSCMFLLAEF